VLVVVAIVPHCTSASTDDPRGALATQTSAPLAVGVEVVLKFPATPLVDQGRAVSSQDQLTFHIERAEDDRVLVVGRDKSIRGWVPLEQVVSLEQADEYYTQVVANDPTDAEAYWIRGRLLFYQHNDDRAIANLNQAIQLEPHQARFFVTRGMVQVQRQLFDRAIEDCDQAIRLDPRGARAFAIRADAWLGKNDSQRARTDLELALQLDPVNPSVGLDRATDREQELSQGDSRTIRKASVGDAQGNKEDPKTAAELVKRGDDRLATKEYDQAIADYDDALRLDPNYAPAYASRAIAWARKHYRDREIVDCTEAIKRDPNNAAYRVARAESWSAQGMHKRAMADFEDALRLEPNNPSIWVSRGNEWRRDLKLDDAIADYTHALQIDPRYGPAYIARGNTWKQRRAFDRAIQEFSNLIRIDPENALAHQTLARILATCHEANFRNGKWAVYEAKRACELTHWRDPDCLDTLAAAYAEVNDFEAAVRWQTQAIKLTRQNVPSLLQQKALNFGGRRGIGFDDRLGFYKSKKPTRE